MSQVVQTWHLLLPRAARGQGIGHRELFTALKEELDAAALPQGVRVLHYGDGPTQMSDDTYVDSCEMLGIRARTKNGTRAKTDDLMGMAGKALVSRWNETNSIPGWRLVKHPGNSLEVVRENGGPTGKATLILDLGQLARRVRLMNSPTSRVR